MAAPLSRPKKGPARGDQGGASHETLDHDQTRDGHGCRELLLAPRARRFSPLVDRDAGTEAPRPVSLWARKHDFDAALKTAVQEPEMKDRNPDWRNDQELGLY